MPCSDHRHYSSRTHLRRTAERARDDAALLPVRIRIVPIKARCTRVLCHIVVSRGKTIALQFVGNRLEYLHDASSSSRENPTALSQPLPSNQGATRVYFLQRKPARPVVSDPYVHFLRACLLVFFTRFFPQRTHARVHVEKKTALRA